MKFEGRKSALQQKEKTHIQENSTFCHTIPPSGAWFKEDLDEQMAFHTGSAFAEKDIHRAAHYFVQKRYIAQRYTREIQTPKVKKTNLRVTGVVQACHNFLFSWQMNKQNFGEDQKEGINDFLNWKRSKILKETYKRGHTTANVKLTIRSARIP